MNAALGLSALDYSRGAGIFFLGYFLAVRAIAGKAHQSGVRVS
jgi:hypothetical protein